MELAIQYDLFQEIDPVKEEMNLIKESLRRTQKRFFAEQGELAKHILRLERDNAALSARLDLIAKNTKQF